MYPGGTLSPLDAHRSFCLYSRKPSPSTSWASQTMRKAEGSSSLTVRLMATICFCLKATISTFFSAPDQPPWPWRIVTPRSMSWMMALAIFLIVKITVPIYKKAQNTLDRVMLLTRENYVGARVVRAFSRQEDEKKEFAGANDLLKGIQQKAGRISALMNPVTYVLVNLAIIAILLQGGVQVDTGTLTQGEVIALVNYMNQILVALIALANLIITASKAWASAARVNEVFDTPSTMKEGERQVKEKEEGWSSVAYGYQLQSGKRGNYRCDRRNRFRKIYSGQPDPTFL